MKLASFLSVLAIAAGGVAIAAPANASTLCASHGAVAREGLMSSPGTLCLSNGSYTAMFQNDNNFVVYKGSVPLWESQTMGNYQQFSLVFQADGNIVIYKPAEDATGHRAALWAANGGNMTYPSYQLQMQSDGNLVEYGYPNPNSNTGRVALWATGTNGK